MINVLAVENFLASLDGMSVTDAFANARADGKSYGWNEATQTVIANGISRFFEAKRVSEQARRNAASDELFARRGLT